MICFEVAVVQRKYYYVRVMTEISTVRVMETKF